MTIKNIEVTPYLPFDLVATTSARKVFAHYMPNFPISIDNKDGRQDYYATQYLTVDGENGRHSAYGGLLRDRPLPRRPSSRSDWKSADLLTEIAQAKSVGIDGFAVDVIQTRTASPVVDLMLRAAVIAKDFTVFITPDMNGPLLALNEADFAAELAPYLAAPAAFRLADGRPVLGAYQAENRLPSWWMNVLNLLRDKYQLSVAFVPTFLDVGKNPEAFAPFSYGVGTWGERNPNAVLMTDTAAGTPLDPIRRTHQLGRIWMQPVAFQDSRPRDGNYEESANGVTNRMAWKIANEHDAQWVQLITWNDYAESTAMAPSVAHGWRILDMNAYDIATFKLGRPPQLVRDAIYISYRSQPVDARPSYPQSLLMSRIPSSVAGQDNVEAVTFSVAPSQLAIRVGARDYICEVPAGRAVCTVPLAVGSIAAELRRDGAAVASARSDVDVTNAPYVQDLQYRVIGGLR